MTRFCNDLVIGEVTEIGSFTFTPDDIKRFARAYDPQPFHTDEEAAKRSHFGALCASGWQTAAIWMKLVIAHHRREAAAALQRGERVARLGPSPGFTDLKWLKPVYAGDRLTYYSTILETRPSASRPEWGLVKHHNLAKNQKGEAVFEFTATVFWELRTD